MLKIIRGLIVSTLFMIISCDFKFPEKWENPSWELPINIPFLETTYYFTGLGNDSTIFVDTTQTLYILFQDSLTNPDGGRVGIDESFDPYFEIEAGIIPEFEDTTFGPIEIQTVSMGENYNFPLTGFGFNPDYLICEDCFPQELLAGGIEIIDTNITEKFFDADSISYFSSVNSISVDEGKILFSVKNEYPFKISHVEFSIISPGLGTIWETTYSDIEGHSFGDQIPSRRDSLLISPENEIVLNEYITFHLNVEIEEQENPQACDCGAFYDGWPLFNNYDRSLEFSFNIDFDHFNELTGILNQFVFSNEIEIEVPNPDSIFISGGKLASEDGKNYLITEINNNFFTSMDLDFLMPNLFYEEESFHYRQLLQADNSTRDSVSFADYLMLPADEEDDAIENISVLLEYRIPADANINDEVTIDMDEIYSVEVDSIYFAPFKFAYINAIFEELEFSSPTLTIENVPSGFEGFTFADIVLDMNIFNQIGIPVKLDLELSGINGLDTTSVPLKSIINYPDYSDGTQIGESVKSQILMQGEEQITHWFDGTDILLSDTIAVTPSILEMMNFAPEIISVGGYSVLDSSGTLAPQTFIWGDFSLKIPFSFIFNDSLSDMKIVPTSTTELQPMDANTRQQIDRSLIAVALHIDMENHTPLAMTITMMVSNRDGFTPYYFNELRTGSLESIRFDLPEEAYYELSSMGVWHVVTESFSEDEGKVSFANFYNSNGELLFWSGRLFDLDLPPLGPENINSDTGHVISSSFGDDEIVISQKKMNWITSDELRYSAPILEFIDSGDEPRTIQTTNYFKISSYLTFVLNTGNMN